MPKPEAELKKAIKRGDLGAVQQILDGSSVHAELPGKVTALEFALAAEKREIAWELLRRGAAPRQRKNANLLLDVPKFRDVDLLRRLVELGSDVQAADQRGQTPLLGAIASGFYDGFRFLIEQGADPLARTRDGSSAFQLLERTRHFCEELLPGAEGEVAELFRAQLADLDRIERNLEMILTPAQVEMLRGEPPEQAMPSTFWQFSGDVEFRLEISPFPFTSRTLSRLRGRLGPHARYFEASFAGNSRIRFRAHDGSGAGNWAPLALVGREGEFLSFTGEATLPAGRPIIEIRFDTDEKGFEGELGGWEIDVNG